MPSTEEEVVDSQEKTAELNNEDVEPVAQRRSTRTPIPNRRYYGEEFQS